MKRIFDFLIALVSLVILAPVLVVVGILVHSRLGRPILFQQIRPGRDARPFKMLKFRSMRDALDAAGQPLSDKMRLTPFGKKLRSTSLDELPGFWNVLKGEMSLVGPRPLLMEYLPLYSPQQARRMDVRPGITGWAQVNGRNTLSWDEKFALDVWYVENRTIRLDLKILWMTVRKVLIRDGITADGDVSMTKFTGSK